MTTVAEGGLLESFGESALQETFDVQKLKAFLASASERFLKVVVISSGGTIVPLEKKAVRFIDNFSTGTRGALCAERFLQYDEAEEQQVGRFAVIFLTREGTKRPFFWNIDVTRLAETCQITSDRICVKDELMAKALEDFKKTQDRLFVVQFKTVQEYLANLRSVAILVRPFRKSVLFFLAAAVSDFFVPESNLPTHKIQSSSEDLTINLKKVPKCLGLLRHEWAPEAFIVSFKLETDESILVQKASRSLEVYNMNCVIGNLLETRYTQVLVVTKKVRKTLISPPKGEMLESMIISEIVSLHMAFEKETR